MDLGLMCWEAALGRRIREKTCWTPCCLWNSSAPLCTVVSWGALGRALPADWGRGYSRGPFEPQLLCDSVKNAAPEFCRNQLLSLSMPAQVQIGEIRGYFLSDALPLLMSVVILHMYWGENKHSSHFLTSSHYICRKVNIFYRLEECQDLWTVVAVSKILTSLLVSKCMLILNTQILYSCSCLTLMELLVIYVTVGPAAGLCMCHVVAAFLAIMSHSLSEALDGESWLV